MTLGEQWSEIAGRLPGGWSSVRAVLTVAEDERADQAALLLGPLSPGRTGSTFRLVVRRGVDASRIFGRLDGEGIRGRLDLVEAPEAEPAAEAAAEEPRPPEPVHPLRSQWEELEERLPADWSDVHAEVELDSSDYLQRAALLLAPVNPAYQGGPTSLRFRSARVAGYGAAPEMTRRCLVRLDEEGITGRLRFLRVLSATRHVGTQGPVWRVGGRSV